MSDLILLRCVLNERKCQVYKRRTDVGLAQDCDASCCDGARGESHGNAFEDQSGQGSINLEAQVGIRVLEQRD